MSWTPARDKEKFGVAIYNFSGINEKCIQLNVGDTVHIQEELEDWYFGHTLQNHAFRGVFPRSFIQIRECYVDKTGSAEVVTPRQPPIVQEVTAVLREWGVLLRDLYVGRKKEYGVVCANMIDLINDRKAILSGQLPGDELKQLKQHITRTIDRTNSILGLDLVVRDDNGNILNPDITSAVKLFRHHENAANLLKTDISATTTKRTSVRRKPHMVWTVFLTVENIVLQVTEPTEISLGLYTGDPYDGTERPLTEAFTILWTTGGYNSQPDMLRNLKFLFTDLSTMILDEDKIWLIGSVVRKGTMNSKELDYRRVSMPSERKDPPEDSIRRPSGVIIHEVTSMIREQKQRSPNHPMDLDPSSEKRANFYPCGDKETLDLKKLLSSRGDTKRDNKTEAQGIWFLLRLINGDVKKLHEENPDYVELRDAQVAYRLGLSEVIMPGDVRNDLYITLLSGEFARGGAKTSDKNVEVKVKIFDAKGEMIPGVIHQGCGERPLDEYRSVTYHHEGKPKWAETFKITLPIEEFKQAHVRFTFRHRSTNDLKDKSDKTFAMSFVKLMQDNGTTLENIDHELVVYKIDSKKWKEGEFHYLDLPSKKQVGEDFIKVSKKQGEEAGKASNIGLSPSAKDSFTIATTFCSTKLTQNENLLRLLEFGFSGEKNLDKLKASLQGLRNVPGEELMIFLQDTLDVMFELMKNNEDDESDNLVFEALIDVIATASEKNKNEAFQPVLDSYIQQNFHSTLAYNKLIHVLKDYIDEGEKSEKQETLKKAMKCIQYVFRFIIRSRQLFVECSDRGHEEFEKSLRQLLNSMATMMTIEEHSILTTQAHCLKFITTIIPDVITCFSPIIMSEVLVDMVNNLDPKRIPHQKLMTMNEVIHSELFQLPECRRIILDPFVKQVKQLLAANEEVTDIEVVMRKERKKRKIQQLLALENLSDITQAQDKTMKEELSLCVKILGDILDVLFCKDIGPTYEDIRLLSINMLEDILSMVRKMKRDEKDDPLPPQFVSVLISLLRQMTERHFKTFFNQFEVSDHFYNFLMELLEVIESLVEPLVFNSDWAEMILLQNNVIVKVLHQVAQVIQEKVYEPFREEIWYKFFHCAIRFICQPSLQIDRFMLSKRNKVLNRYKDMRKETATDIKALWFGLGQC